MMLTSFLAEMLNGEKIDNDSIHSIAGDSFGIIEFLTFYYHHQLNNENERKRVKNYEIIYGN